MTRKFFVLQKFDVNGFDRPEIPDTERSERQMNKLKANKETWYSRLLMMNMPENVTTKVAKIKEGMIICILAIAMIMLLPNFWGVRIVQLIMKNGLELSDLRIVGWVIGFFSVLFLIVKMMEWVEWLLGLIIVPKDENIFDLEDK